MTTLAVVSEATRRGQIPALLTILLALGSLLPVLSRPAWAGPSTLEAIEPGPRTMTPEEKALAPDPDRGAGAGIILLEETDRDERSGQVSHLTYHLRAKVFSAEGAVLGSVRIPVEGEWGKLQNWWGRTLWPDGRVQEVKRSDLRDEAPRSAGRAGTRVLAGVLPVEPGCVIDYGYVVVVRKVDEWQTFDLVHVVPVRELRYRWTPGGKYTGSYGLPPGDGPTASVSHEGGTFLFTAKNVPALGEESWTPPDRDVHARVILYYHDAAATEANYWGSLARQITRAAEHFSQGPAIRQAIASMQFPASSDLKGRLKLAYEWVQQHVKVTDTFFLRMPPTRLGWGDALQAEEILGRGSGDCRYVTFLYWGVARALGAQVGFVPATDRSEMIFDPSLLTLSQFTRYLLAVGAPGDSPENLAQIDICTGLPFGKLPWWHTGFDSVLLGPANVNRLKLRPSAGSENPSMTEAGIFFRDDRTETIQWVTTFLGQNRLENRLYLKESVASARKHAIQALCGEGGQFEIVRSEEAGSEELGGPFRLQCEAKLTGASPDTSIGTFRARFVGPWLPPVPRLPSAGRVHPIVFDFPRIDRARIGITAPRGFIAAGAPAPIRLESPFGQYSLSATVTPDGYQVDRSFNLVPTNPVPVEDYAALRAFLLQAIEADETLLEFRRVPSGGQPQPNQ